MIHVRGVKHGSCCLEVSAVYINGNIRRELYICIYRVATHATVPVKRHRGEPGHTRDTRAQTSTRKTQTNLTTIQTHQNTRTTARRPNPGPNPRPAQQPMSTAASPDARSRTRSPRPTQKRPPSANPTLPHPAPKAPPRACSKAAWKAVGEMKARAADANRRVQRPAVAGMPAVACVWRPR